MSGYKIKNVKMSFFEYLEALFHQSLYLEQAGLGYVIIEPSRSNGKSNTYFNKVSKSEIEEKPSLAIVIENYGVKFEDYKASVT